MATQERLLRLPEVMARTGLARATVYKKIKLGLFPPQQKIGLMSGWYESAVSRWVKNPK